jgi:hypothetical protein
MPRHPEPDAAVAVLTRMPVEMAAALKSIAADENRSVAAVVRDLLRAQLHLRDPERDQLALDFDSAADGEGSSAA